MLLAIVSSVFLEGSVPWIISSTGVSLDVVAKLRPRESSAVSSLSEITLAEIDNCSLGGLRVLHSVLSMLSFVFFFQR